MRPFMLLSVLAIALAPLPVSAQQTRSTESYSVLKSVKIGGEGGFDYVYADGVGRRLYIPRSGQSALARIAVFNLDTLEPMGDISGVSAHGAAVDPKSHHGFATSNPVVMWDTKTLATIKTIDMQGKPQCPEHDGARRGRRLCRRHN